jgi:hypothetical protein
MRRTSTLTACLLALLLALLAAPAAKAQVAGLYYKEVEKDGRVYIFNTPERYKSFQDSGGDMGTAVTLINRGPNGETLVAENETAMDLYLFKHNLEAYERPTPKPPVASPFPSTKIGGRVYADFTDKENKDKGRTGGAAKSSDSGEGIDVKRFYFTVTHDFDAVWSAQFQSDIGDQGARRYDVFVKKAFIQGKFSPLATLRLGSADTPWVPFVEGLYGFRYFETTLTDHLGFGTSADWGVHLLGSAPNGHVAYQFSVVNGKTYSNPTRTKSVDFEGRVSVQPITGLTLAVGGYSGKRGNDTDATPAKHTAQRTDALVNYANDRLRIGGEWFEAKDWNQTTLVPTDKSDGYSTWVSFAATPMFTLFGRYDNAKPSKDLRPALEFTYYNAGVQWRFNKSLATSLGYKHAEVKGGTVSTSNGTIGSTVAGRKGEYNEVGLWAVYDF